MHGVQCIRELMTILGHLLMDTIYLIVSASPSALSVLGLAQVIICSSTYFLEAIGMFFL